MKSIEHLNNQHHNEPELILGELTLVNTLHYWESLLCLDGCTDDVHEPQCLSGIAQEILGSCLIAFQSDEQAFAGKSEEYPGQFQQRLREELQASGVYSMLQKFSSRGRCLDECPTPLHDDTCHVGIANRLLVFLNGPAKSVDELRAFLKSTSGPQRTHRGV